MTTLVGGIGFLMMMIGAAGGCNEEWGALTASLVILLAGAILMYAACKLEDRRKSRKRRYIKR